MHVKPKPSVLEYDMVRNSWRIWLDMYTYVQVCRKLLYKWLHAICVQHDVFKKPQGSIVLDGQTKITKSATELSFEVTVSLCFFIFICFFSFLFFLSISLIMGSFYHLHYF